MARTSQLQIRISHQEKATLKRLADLSGQSVSAYVLSRALPTATDVMSAALHGLRDGTTSQAKSLAALRRLVAGMSPEALAESLAQANISDLPPATQNYVAGVTEQLAAAVSAEPPAWAASVTPLERPHFKWPLQSLRPYQLRTSPVALKRRNIFDPTEGGGSAPPPLPVSHSELLLKLQVLSQHLVSLELDVEFYFIGDRILSQEFPAKPPGARPATLFRFSADAGDAVAAFADRQGWKPGWLEEAVRPSVRAGTGAGSYLELPGLHAFTPPTPYAFVMKLAGRREGDARATDDLRFLIRTLTLTTTDLAFALVGQYMSERQLPADTRAMLTGLIGR